MEQNQNSVPSNQWNALNRFLFIYKAAGAAIALICVMLVVLCILLTNRRQIVVMASDQEAFYFIQKDSNSEIKEQDVKNFVQRFVKNYYNWNELLPEKILTSICPLATEGFKENTLPVLRVRKDKEFLGKKLQQSVAGVSIQVSKEATIATFDVVMRVEGIPLVVPMQVSFQLVMGDKTEWNPLGLYVNSVTEHEGK